MDGFLLMFNFGRAPDKLFAQRDVFLKNTFTQFVMIRREMHELFVSIPPGNSEKFMSQCFYWFRDRAPGRAKLMSRCEQTRSVAREKSISDLF
jgi:hypothetical protein